MHKLIMTAIEDKKTITDMYQALKVFTNDFVTFDVEVSVLAYGMTALYGIKQPVIEYLESYLRANDIETVNDYDLLNHYDKVVASCNYEKIIGNLDLHAYPTMIPNLHKKLWDEIKPKIHTSLYLKAEDELLKRILFDRFDITETEVKFATHLFNILIEKNKRDASAIADDFLIFIPLVDYAVCLH